MPFVNMTCKKCGGSIEFDDSREFATCLYCGSKVMLDRPTTPTNSTYQPLPPRSSRDTGTHRPGDPYYSGSSDPYGRNSNPYGNSRNPYGHNSDPYGRNANPYGGSQPPVTAAKKINLKTIAVIIAVIVVAIFLISWFSTTPKLSAETFRAAVGKAGYDIDEDKDYDGYGTHWIGAFKFPDGVEKKEYPVYDNDGKEINPGNKIFVIDWTLDQSEYNAQIEYSKYVGEVKAIGGTAVNGSGRNYEFQTNTGKTLFGVAYRVGMVNLYCIAPVENKEEILSFFDILEFNIKK